MNSWKIRSGKKSVQMAKTHLKWHKVRDMKFPTEFEKHFESSWFFKGMNLYVIAFFERIVYIYESTLLL